MKKKELKMPDFKISDIKLFPQFDDALDPAGAEVPIEQRVAPGNWAKSFNTAVRSNLGIDKLAISQGISNPVAQGVADIDAAAVILRPRVQQAITDLFTAAQRPWAASLRNSNTTYVPTTDGHQILVWLIILDTSGGGSTRLRSTVPVDLQLSWPPTSIIKNAFVCIQIDVEQL
jgi:hypothetical protein